MLRSVRFGRQGRPIVVPLLTAALAAIPMAHAADGDPFSSPEYLKRLPLEQLAQVEVVSATRGPALLSDVPYAIDVISNDRIRRSGVTSLPDALRLATGLQVAQVNGREWAISARGFNAVTASKLQVLMDGRSLYTPLFSGVFWDVQHAFLPDLEVIEVIRGPNATLWGANAVNGVINIRSKSARDTQGWLLHGGGGLEERGFGGIRYGGQTGNTFYRAYVSGLSRDSLRLQEGGDGGDEYAFLQGGFRVDSYLADDQTLTLQGDLYEGSFGSAASGGVADGKARGGNVLARWSRDFGDGANLMLQTYYDRTYRLLPGSFEETRDTLDVELQHRFRATDHLSLVWGLNYRSSRDQIGNIGDGLAFLPEEETLQLGAAYFQGTYEVVPDRFSVMLGARLEYNSYSGFEVQPAMRFLWKLTKEQTLWGAVSRAVRTPTRIDRDLVVPNPASGQPTFLMGSEDFDSEELIAYELGYRAQITPRASLDLVLYYHQYDQIRSVEPQGVGQPALILNGLEAETYGGSVNLNWQITPWWRLRAGYMLFDTRVRLEDGSNDVNRGRGEGNDPNHVLVAHSSFDLTRNVEFDAILRYMDRLPDPATDAYLTLDLRLGWHINDNLEIAIIGRNLLDDGHPEFERTSRTWEVERSVFGTITWRF
jgi:iron complex outermembrane recepter protein